LRQNRLNENFQRASADQPDVVACVMIQIKGHLARLFAANHVFRRALYSRSDAPAADGANNRTVIANEHARAFIAGNRAVGVHDGCNRAPSARTPRSYYFLENVHEFFALRAIASTSPFSDVRAAASLIG